MKTESKRHLIKALINKCLSIPTKRWISCHFDDGHGAHCFLGHLGVTKQMFEHPYDHSFPPLAQQTVELFGDAPTIIQINDNDHPVYGQRGPRSRILAALHDKLKEVL
jgi:hypothetical protein